MTKDPILPKGSCSNELMELDQQNERPLTIGAVDQGGAEIDWGSDEGHIAMELYEEIIAKGLASPRQINSALDSYADALARGRQRR